MYFTDLEGEEKAFYLKQLTPQPLAPFFEKIHFNQFPKIPVPKTYILGLRTRACRPN